MYQLIRTEVTGQREEYCLVALRNSPSALADRKIQRNPT
jgi:hypothetical protein